MFPHHPSVVLVPFSDYAATIGLLGCSQLSPQRPIFREVGRGDRKKNMSTSTTEKSVRKHESHSKHKYKETRAAARAAAHRMTKEAAAKAVNDAGQIAEVLMKYSDEQIDTTAKHLKDRMKKKKERYVLEKFAAWGDRMGEIDSSVLLCWIWRQTRKRSRNRSIFSMRKWRFFAGTIFFGVTGVIITRPP